MTVGLALLMPNHYLVTAKYTTVLTLFKLYTDILTTDYRHEILFQFTKQPSFSCDKSAITLH